MENSIVNGNGDLNKDEIDAELKKKMEEQIQKNVQDFKDFVLPGTVLVVRFTEKLIPQWLTSLNPSDLNMVLDRMKFFILNPKPKESSIIEKPNGIMAGIKGAFGKKRF